ncbi:MAG: single-stranded-DNA-specific exonuclease RecJ [Phycisphaerae bacterium]|nr:single-stranded-DNA-specific exonuclease RecJ [Phycisphaerae bacterium]
MHTSPGRTREKSRIETLIKSSKARSAAPQKQWVIHPPHPDAGELAKSLKVSPLLAQVLLNRGITDVHTGSVFLRPKLNELISPELMPGVKPAVERIKKAVKARERITIYGDYDVDGITGAAILWQVLTLLNADVNFYIPHRIDEGYGLNEEAVQILAQAGTKLLITVDCGISAVKSAELAGQLGLDLIITDHHAPDHELPKAVAIVHPAMDKSYPNQDSSGSMVAYKLAWAIANEFTAGGSGRLEPKLREFMLNATSLAAMGTIADIVDLRGENRILTSYGLKSLPQCKLAGVQALIESAGFTGQGLDSFRIGFHLAPMLNAAGRMGHARLAVELLINDSPVRSTEIAQYLKEQNDQRRKCERKIFEQAREKIVKEGLDSSDRTSFVLAGQTWHSGVIGIVASRIVDLYNRPTIMINIGSAENGIAQGSARSIDGFCLLSAIKACSHHLVSFGGHKMAAGITIETEKIDRFAADFEAYVKQHLAKNDCAAKLHIDAAAPLSEFRKETVSELQMLSPYGRGNPSPLFTTKGVRLASPPKICGSKGSHLQLAITDNTNAIRCIGFGMGKLEKKLLEHEFFDVAYQPQLNTYNGNCNVEFVLADIRLE